MRGFSKSPCRPYPACHRTALQDAASVAGLLITTEAMVAELPEDDKPGMPGGGMPDMGGMGF